MPSTRDIRRRIKSVKNTAQITRAMQMVAASKMKKAQDQASAGRSYADLLNEVLVNLKEQTEAGAHPLLEEHESGGDLVVVVTSDKGLCGALNTNLLKQVFAQTGPDCSYVTVGRKGRNSLAKTGRNLVADFTVKDPVPFAESKLISKFVIEKFLDKEYRRVRVAFTNFINTIRQEPLIETLLPIRPIDLGHKVVYGPDHSDTAPEPKPLSDSSYGYIFEPDPAAVLNVVVPQYVDFELYQILLESRASEHSARMVAMKNATDNAKELIADLTLAYNKQRQAAITSELLEITTAMKAME